MICLPGTASSPRCGSMLLWDNHGRRARFIAGLFDDEWNAERPQVLDWPASGFIEAAGVAGRIWSARFLATREELEFTQSTSHVRVEVPAQAPDPIDTVIVLELRRRP